MNKSFRIEDVVVKSKVLPIHSREVESLEKELNIKFPLGYLELVCNLGEGWLDDIRIYPPIRIKSGINNLYEWRKRIEEYWFWDDEPIVITKVTALECIIIADNSNGDEFIFHPDEPNKIYILPRDDEKALIVEGGLFKFLEWYSNDEVMVEAFETWAFEPFEETARRDKKWWEIWK